MRRLHYVHEMALNLNIIGHLQEGCSLFFKLRKWHPSYQRAMPEQILRMQSICGETETLKLPLENNF